MEHSNGFLSLVNEARKQIKELNVDDVKKKMDNKENFVLVDTREDNEWEKNRIPGAIHLGKGVIERDIEKQVPDKTAQVILYCGGGFRSVLAAVNLQKMGYKDVISMDGGIRDWKNKGYPLEE